MSDFNNDFNNDFGMSPIAPMTARDIIILALKECGVLGVGQTPLAEDINDGYTLLRRMTAQWNKKRWLVPALIDISMPGNDNKSYTIGPGGYFNVPRPPEIKGGYIVQLNTGSTPVSLPLKDLFSYENYIQISVKDLNSLPYSFFYDGEWPLGNIFVWPVPNNSYQLHFLVQAVLNFPDPLLGLDTIFHLPEEYEEALHYNLAVRLFSMYQLDEKPSTVNLAKTSLNTIRSNNTQVPTLGMPVGLRRPKAFNLFNADGT